VGSSQRDLSAPATVTDRPTERPLPPVSRTAIYAFNLPPINRSSDSQTDRLFQDDMTPPASCQPVCLRRDPGIPGKQYLICGRPDWYGVPGILAPTGVSLRALTCRGVAISGIAEPVPKRNRGISFLAMTKKKCH